MSNYYPHPATVRPGMYTGDQGNRTREQWLIDALKAYSDASELMVDMNKGKKNEPK